MKDHEEIELLLEGYRSDLQEMQIELRSMRGQIDDTRDFINTYQVSIRPTFYEQIFLHESVFRSFYVPRV